MWFRNLNHLERSYFSSVRYCSTNNFKSFKSTAESKNHSCLDGKLKMVGWQIHNYGHTEELQYAKGLRMPQIQSSSDCLVRVHATTVNPIDVAMLEGYGSKMFNMLRCKFSSAIEFPLILGREFCGEVIQCGMGAKNGLRVGERVWGVVPLQLNGSHAQYVVVPDYCLSAAPKGLSNEQAASVLYGGLTAWSGLYITGRLGGICGAVSSTGGGANKRVLVMGGSGSVGSLAIQILKSQKATVFATCSEDAIELVKNLGADYVVDYKNATEFDALSSYAPFDIVLDCAGQGIEQANKIRFPFRQYITFSPPFVRNLDNLGFGLGMIKNVTDMVETNTKAIYSNGGLLKWGFFTPAPQGIELLSQLVEKKQLLPLIDSSFTFEQLPDAFDKMQRGHLRGKLVITVP
ncbi:reticulon-4-interacting protein 1 homolog, mitochondrial isoform X1 [Anastrepha obliqua]|uniref:reticulon-4-interacting protein 1 homolog, mitochondrial isoform X1 n=1 Tax=Anastrepha obliqua TaxID=95512 RepID=UPI00240924E0|nr:reticulon-4-interacting protein 1 homolog, mitochondrial isoform X1 [Anastrepha obliqua]